MDTIVRPRPHRTGEADDTDDFRACSFITTIGIDFKIRTIEIEGKRVKLQIVRRSMLREVDEER